MAMWRWGSGPPVLLVHGWGGNAGRLTRFVPALLDAGFGIVAFDAPAHGLSGGHFATLPDFVDAIERIARVVSPVALVGHSMGAAACALALRRGLEARAAVLLSAPADPELYAVRFARYLRLTPAATEAMKRRLQERYQVQLRDLWLGSGGPPVPTLVFHDERDPRVPLREGLAIASSWPRAELVATRGLGHHRILRDSGVIGRAVNFLRQAAGDGKPASPPAVRRRGRGARRPAPAGTVLEETGVRPDFGLPLEVES
jgi:pimeloyl-ACP methyl ester carboxylesterase